MPQWSNIVRTNKIRAVVLFSLFMLSFRVSDEFSLNVLQSSLLTSVLIGLYYLLFRTPVKK